MDLKGITFTSEKKFAYKKETLKKQGVSKEEKSLLTTIKEILPKGTRLVENDRSILEGKELDIYIPKYKLAVEYDGLYFHTEKNGKGPDYHYNKTLKCEEKGIRLIHIFSDEWEKKKPQVINHLKKATGLFDRVEEISSVERIYHKKANPFFEAYSLKAPEKLCDCYVAALNSASIPIAIGAFNKIDGITWEMVCFETRGGSYVENALSQILSFFLKEHLIAHLYYKVDGRLDIKEDFTSEGFKLIKRLPPDYSLTNTFTYRISQDEFHKFYKDRITGLSYEKLLESNGYVKVWDCGGFLLDACK